MLICAINLLLGLFVLLRNPHAKTGISFFLMTFVIDVYAITNFLTNNAHTVGASSVYNRLAYLSAYLALLTTLVFTRFFVGKKKILSPRFGTIELTAVLVAGLFSLTPSVTGSVAGVKGNYTFTTGTLTFVYDAVLLFLLVFIIRYLWQFYKRGDASQKNQAKIIALGFTASILIAMVTNAILPALSSDYKTTALGPPLLSLLLVASITYAIVRHQLFDIRPLVARSFAYVLTLLSITAAYSVLVFGFINRFFATEATFNQEAVYVTFTMIAALSFQPLSHAFNKLANRIFLRDYYEPEVVLDRLSNSLVGTVDVEDIEKAGERILKGAIHPAFVHFLLSINPQSDRHLLNLLAHHQVEVIDFDEIYEAHHGALFSALKAGNIALAVKLRTRHQQLGYLLLGYKASGNPYSEGDKRLLGTAADEIAIALQNALRFEEIQHFNVTLQERIEEATKQLRHANHRLKELDQTKDEFISMASHQLRTPLTTIKGYLSMVLEGDVGPVTIDEKQMIQQAFDSAERMVFLIADLLNVSRLQSGKFVIENKPTDLAKMVESEVSLLKDTAEHHKLKLTLKKPDKYPLLNLDDTKIRQVIMNFLDNAIYYTPAGGSIEVELGLTDSAVTYTVTDTGLGVPKAEQHHLFSKFYRAGNARKMRPDGTGLGLFMAKKVIVAQGGSIIFKSEEGKGSTFGFTFPRHKVELKDKTPAKPAKEAVAA